MIEIRPPDVARPHLPGSSHAPNWSEGDKPFLNSEHEQIFAATRSLPGWQDPGDSHKLYEMAFHNGGVILEIGIFGGRSAVVELRGAIAGAKARGLEAPQYYGLDVEVSAIVRGYKTLHAAGLMDHAVLFHGELARFLAEVPITPTMVFVDGDHSYAGCWHDLRLLASRLVAGTPVLCHDYGWIPGVRRAVDESIAAGAFEPMGCFASSILLRTTNKVCAGRPATPRTLSADGFKALRSTLLTRYFSDAEPKSRPNAFYTPTRDLTAPFRSMLLGTSAAPSAARDWPHSPFSLDGICEADLPRLTVLTPAANNAGTIAECLLSVTNQGYPNVEHLVADIGSSDGALAIAHRSPECRVVPMPEGLEAAAALREAVNVAAGSHIIWLDADDVLEPGALWEIARVIGSRTEERDTHLEASFEPQNRGLARRVFRKAEVGRRRVSLRPGDLRALAVEHGRVILAIGLVGSRSGLLELRGALASTLDRDLPMPQFFGVDPDPRAIKACRDSLAAAELERQSLLYRGTLSRFTRELPVEPTMVVVDGMYGYRNARSLLDELRAFLAPGTPILVRNFSRRLRLRRVVEQAIESGSFERIRTIGDAILITCGSPSRAPAGGSGGFTGRGLSPEQFDSARMAMLTRRADEPGVLDVVTESCRMRLLSPNGEKQRAGRAIWPFVAEPRPLPATLPNGKPWPRISIVTPSFNQGRYIEETLLSVRNQGYPNVEHIVMDGGSTDETLEIIDRYRDGLTRVVSAKDRGQSDAINRGFKLATGDILTWLNSDDMLAPGALAAIAMGFHESGADIVAGECHIHRNGKMEARHLTACKDGPLPLEDLLDVEGCWLEGQFFYQPELMFTRRIWERAGGHVREDLYHSMDYELWLRMAEAGARIHAIGRPVALFRAHAEQKTAGTVVGGFRVELPKARDAFLAARGRVFEPKSRAARKERIRIVMVNDLGFAYGAGIAHRRLAEAFRQAGHDVVAIAASLTDYHHSSPRATVEESVRQIAAAGPDLVVVGNMHGARMDPQLLAALSAQFVTAFVMHDLWLLTGRCAYTGTCRDYLKRCGPHCTCPSGHPDLAGDLIGPAWDTKRRVLGGSPNLSIWANSKWASELTREALSGAGALAGPEPGVIKFGFELDTLRPRDKDACRDLLGLPRDKFIIMSSASSVADPRKGLAHLAEALQLLHLSDALVVCVGWFGNDEKPPIPGMRAMGYEKDPMRLAALYSASDIFVGPSLEEAFGQVYIEAAACGTPSVGYPVGGKPEAIFDGVSGRLARRVRPDALADAIHELYSNRALRENMGRWGRIWVENQWSMSSSYRRIYHVLSDQGLSEGLGLGRRLGLVVQPQPVPTPSALGSTVPGWRNISNFDMWEGPYPDRGIGRCRWALGPIAAFEIDSESDEPATLVVSGRCFQAGQRVRLLQGGAPIGERDFPESPTKARSDSFVSFPITLRRGVNRFEFHFWKWAPGARPMALLVTSITAVSAGQPARTGVLIESKPGERVRI